MDWVKIIIDTWDPVDLLPYSPNDEYHSEIEEIEQLLNLTSDPIELAEGIFKIFTESFGEGIFGKDISECRQIAQLIISYKC